MRGMSLINPFFPFSTPQPPAETLQRRVEYQKEALEQAERDLEAARERASVDDGREGKLEKRRCQATLDERKRILSILDSPVALRQPRLAKKFVESDFPARDAVAAMEGYERDTAASRAKSTADLIVRAGQMRRGEAAAPVTGAGPKVLVKATAEEIIKAGKKARGED
jgi:hypothetical protein